MLTLYKFITTILLSSLLMACGGGAASSQPDVSTTTVDTSNTTNIQTDTDNSDNPQTQTNNNPIILTGDIETTQGQSTALVAYHPTEIIADYQWKQLSGSPVALSSYRQGLVTFIPDEMGLYDFEVTITLENGETFRDSIQINVTASTEALDIQKIELLRDRAVMGNRTFTMRLSTDNFDNLDTSNLTVEVAGNFKYKLSANLNKETGELYLHSAQTTIPQLIKLILKDNEQVVDEAYVLIEASNDSTSPYFCNGSGVYCATTKSLGRTFVYNPSSPYRDVLQDCTYSNQLRREDLCSISILPPLGYQHSYVTTEDIRDRLIVSEEWMGDRFLDFMNEMDAHDDLKTLFGSATAVVISDNIKVPFYWALTGTIYLSPYDLYANETEYLSVAEPYDYHQYIANGASTAFMWQYLKGDRNIAVRINPERDLQDIYYNFAALLYHELSHANDFYPYHKVNNFDQNLTMLDNLEVVNQMTSNQLTMTYPLTSNELRSLAMYSFQNRTIDADLLDTDTLVFADAFLNDGANDLYNYVNEKEDMAMLFEETMMKYRFDIDRHVMIYDQRNDEVVKMTKNRIFDSNVSPRALMVATHILPDKVEGFEIFFNN